MTSLGTRIIAFAFIGLTLIGIWCGYLLFSKHQRIEARILETAYYSGIKQRAPVLQAILADKSLPNSDAIEENIFKGISDHNQLPFEKDWVHVSIVDNRRVCTIAIPKMQPIVVDESGIRNN
jgi:flagellar motor component MotA